MMFTYIDIRYFLGLIALISYVFTNHWLKEILRFQRVLIFYFFYLPIPIDNSLWHARIGVLYFKIIAQK